MKNKVGGAGYKKKINKNYISNKNIKSTFAN